MEEIAPPANSSRTLFFVCSVVNKTEILTSNLVKDRRKSINHLFGSVEAHTFECIRRLIPERDARVGQPSTIIHLPNDRGNCRASKSFEISKCFLFR